MTMVRNALLTRMFAEHRNNNVQANNETIEAVRAAVAQHVPMDIKGVRSSTFE
jgi:hypothetical protein